MGADPTQVAERYFDAWNRRDPEAITATFAEGGTYTDPAVPDGLGPEATGRYAAGLFESFPDLAFEVGEIHTAGAGHVAARWTMTGTNDGPFQQLPPSGRAVSLEGADFITVAGDRIQEVVGLFDSGSVPRQLGLDVVVQPRSIGPFSFGTSTYVSRSGAEPGAVSLTVLEARTEEERNEVSERSRDTAMAMLGMPGFVSWLGVVAGDRMFTITAWEGPDDPAGLRSDRAHAEAMRRFFATPGLARGGQTGVWTPHRLNGLWARCGTCDRMVRYEPDGACECGAALEPTAYW